jgi:hypothetical protein
LPTRSTPIALVLVALLAVACGAAVPATNDPTVAPASPVVRPDLTPVPVPSVVPTALPNEGDVDGVQDGRPELTIESVTQDELRVTVMDPTAKAWRIAVTGKDAADRLELIIETGDIAPGIRIDEIVGNEVVNTDDLTRMPDQPTVSAGGCHRTLGVCFSSDTIEVGAANGIVSATFRFRDTSRPIAITGSTASWPGEPFILGDWRDSLSYRSWEA